MDAHYGEQPWLLDSLQDRGLLYVADIAKNTQIFVGEPEVNVEELANDKFRVSIKGEGAIAVQDLVAQNRLEFRKITVRDTQRGKLIINFAAIRVRRSCNNTPLPGECWLLVRQELDGTDTKYSFIF